MGGQINYLVQIFFLGGQADGFAGGELGAEGNKIKGNSSLLSWAWAKLAIAMKKLVLSCAKVSPNCASKPRLPLIIIGIQKV